MSWLPPVPNITRWLSRVLRALQSADGGAPAGLSTDRRVPRGAPVSAGRHATPYRPRHRPCHRSKLWGRPGDAPVVADPRRQRCVSPVRLPPRPAWLRPKQLAGAPEVRTAARRLPLRTTPLDRLAMQSPCRQCGDSVKRSGCHRPARCDRRARSSPRVGAGRRRRRSHARPSSSAPVTANAIASARSRPAQGVCSNALPPKNPSSAA